mmetsp:Transcript_19148/g.53869  ORF Transcript_19148/g.53869 Transcript_19148/m.53869 type:complete len:257 (-) Transcript_19148:215-985(-)
MSAFKRRTLEPPLMGRARKLSGAVAPLGDGGPVRASIRRLGDITRSCSLCTKRCNSAVEGSREAKLRAEARLAASASKRCVCSQMAERRDSCSDCSASRMPSATPSSSSTGSWRPNGSATTPMSGELQMLTPPHDDGGRVDGVIGGVGVARRKPERDSRERGPKGASHASPPRRYSRTAVSRTSGTKSSIVWPQASAWARTSSRTILACLRRRSRCWLLQNCTCCFFPWAMSSPCCSYSATICFKDASSAHSNFVC